MLPTGSVSLENQTTTEQKQELQCNDNHKKGKKKKAILGILQSAKIS